MHAPQWAHEHIDGIMLCHSVWNKACFKHVLCHNTVSGIITRSEGLGCARHVVLSTDGSVVTVFGGVPIQTVSLIACTIDPLQEALAALLAYRVPITGPTNNHRVWLTGSTQPSASC